MQVTGRERQEIWTYLAPHVDLVRSLCTKPSCAIFLVTLSCAGVSAEVLHGEALTVYTTRAGDWCAAPG